MKKLKIVLALSPYPSAKYVANKLSKSKNVVGVIFEKRRTTREVLMRMFKRAKKRGVIRLLDEILFRVLDWVTRKGKKSMLNSDILNIENIPKVFVKSINDPESVKFTKDLKADILIVYGTGILKKEIINVPSQGVLNIHPGITPEYRGLEPTFWAMTNQDFDKTGVTIHYIDEGIDTGRILAQETVEVEKNDSYHTLFEKSIEKGMDLILNVISDMENGKIKTIDKTGSISKVYSRPGISNYFAYRRAVKSLKKY